MKTRRGQDGDEELFESPWLLDLLGAVAALALAGVWAVAGFVLGWDAVEIICGVVAILLGFVGLWVIGSRPFSRLHFPAKLVIQIGFASNTLGLLLFAALRILS